MVNFINSWVQGIVIAVIISTIIEMILPNGNIKKYVRTVIGAYIVFVMVSPIVTKVIGKEFSLSSFKLPEVESYEQTAIDTNAYIEDTYINKIKQDIIENVEKKGYKVESVIVDIETQEENYGNIKKITLKVSKEEVKTSNIEPVEINIDEDPKEVKTLDDEEIQEIKVFLRENYGTENIELNI